MARPWPAPGPPLARPRPAHGKARPHGRPSVPYLSVAWARMRMVVDDQVDSVTVTDASSRYGTFVNGQQLAANTPTALHAHDELQLGGPTCKLVYAAPLSPRAPSQRGSLTPPVAAV